MKRTIITLAAVAALTGCASKPSNIEAAYVSPVKYDSFTCAQIQQETAAVERRVNDLRESLDREAKADAWQMGVGLVLFWPALFALEGGDGAEAALYSQLKGEAEALRVAHLKKNCGVSS